MSTKKESEHQACNTYARYGVVCCSTVRQVNMNHSMAVAEQRGPFDISHVAMLIVLIIVHRRNLHGVWKLGTVGTVQY